VLAVNRPAVRDVAVRADGIRLGQLLKLAGLVDSGSDVKVLLEQGAVTVDGRLEIRRGRQLVDGEVVAVRNVRVRVVMSR
jgi:ribosome-associated protein